ncbi:hypothetical protein CSC70_05975 [Pseudoxanthomonas kalamensis DSM 18571]|uniref:EF-hand domain-containing protein n=1 Tax=Pseudoxanthomonas kalamensis TaxID=289483 RepID=UPI001391F66D|nr:EF-hand domain-containing protein [Pseudoxanthomonas kalamensis]KAF1711448.1 hypothetical protein CSC70_05975 [Pseudoxanthomonas kalamensis DSM 18571]
MIHKYRYPIAIAAVLALAVPAAFAQEAQQAQDATVQEAQATPEAATDSQMDWAQIDADSDGSITREEAAASPGLAQVFERADADADGKLTPEEYRGFVGKNYPAKE